MVKTPHQEAARKEIKTFFRQLTNMYFMLFAGIFLFMVTAIIVVYFQKALRPDYTTFLYFGAPVSSMALMLMARKLAADRFKTGFDQPKLYQKMDAYRSGVVLQMIVLDGAAFVMLLAYVFSGVFLFVYLCMAVMTVFLLSKPGMEKFMKEMNLNEMERKVVRDHSY